MDTLFILLLSVTIIQLVFAIWFHMCFSLKGHPTYFEEQDSVSVIVAVKNELGNLRELIPMLLKQNHHDFEVIVADDQSDDQTISYLKSLNDRRLRFVVVGKGERNISPKKTALALAVAASSKNVLLFTDADCRPVSSIWIREMTKGIATIRIGISPYQKQPGMLNNLIRYETVTTALNYLSFADRGIPYMGVGRNLAIRKTFYLKQGGLSGFMSFTGGDDDLFVNYFADRSLSMAYSHESQTLSIPKENWADWYRQKLRHLHIGKRYSMKTKLLLGFQTMSGLCFYLLGIMLLVYPAFSFLVLLVYIIRIAILTINLKRFSHHIKQPFSWYAVPLLDFLYHGYLLMIGTSALFIKKVRWI